jgi:hypothetical protein
MTQILRILAFVALACVLIPTFSTGFVAAETQSGTYGSSSSSAGPYSQRIIVAQGKKAGPTCDSILNRCLAQCRRQPSANRSGCQDSCYADNTWCHICGPWC